MIEYPKMESVADPEGSVWRKVNALYLAETSPGDSETGHDRSTTVDATDAAGSGAGESRWSTRGISWSRRAAGSGQM